MAVHSLPAEQARVASALLRMQSNEPATVRVYARVMRGASLQKSVQLNALLVQERLR